MRIRLVVLKLVIEIWLMLLDERCFENEGFSFVVGNDHLYVGNLLDELLGLNAVTEFAATTSLEIRKDSVAQVLDLADINDFPVGVFVEIDPRRAGNLFEFFVESH